MSEAIIVFVKNPVPGSVKTRLAKTVGAAYALEVYKKLLMHTCSVCEKVPVNKFVYYSDFIDTADQWNGFGRRLQTGMDLGERMGNAFNELFDLGNKKLVIIGSDCMEITTAVIEDAFDKLRKADVVIGPATDGGYYLLGMKQFYPDFFMNKNWSTSFVLQQTLDDIAALNLSFQLLPVLTDIDEEKDLGSLYPSGL